MVQRETPLAINEFYHVYNRGVDKRVVFKDKQDFFQFVQMLDYFNQEDSLGSLKEYKYPKNLKHGGSTSVLVEIVAYCLNKNHYHLILKQVANDGISRFMQKVGTGYTMYFNKKYKRTGSLFGGRFKSKHIGTDAYLNHVGVYVNLNNRVHKQHRGSTSVLHKQHRGSTSVLHKQHRGSTSVLIYVSSWNEYIGKSKLKLCNTKYLMNTFKTADAYKKYAQNTLKDILKNKDLQKDLED